MQDETAQMNLTLTPYAPADHAWLTHLNQSLYTDAEGFDQTFGPLVSSILSEFETAHDPTCEAGWVLRCGNDPMGSIFCVRQGPQTAKLRLFLLDPDLRGQGQGARLLSHCMTFAKTAGYRHMTLWTHQSHRAACALYERFGWHVESSKPVISFGVPLVEQEWKTTLER